MDVLESKEFFSACEAPTDDFQNFLGIQSKKARTRNFVGAEKFYRDAYPEPKTCEDVKPTVDNIKATIETKKKDREGAKAKRTKNNIDNEINILTAMQNEYSRLSVELCQVRTVAPSGADKVASTMPPTIQDSKLLGGGEPTQAAPIAAVVEQGQDIVESAVVGAKSQNKTLYYLIGGIAAIGIIYAIAKK